MIGLLGSKKGQNADNIIIPIVTVFGLALAFILSTTIALEIFDGYRTVFSSPAMASYNSAEIQDTIDSYESAYSLFDKLLFSFVIGLIIGMAWVSYRIAARPLYFIVTVVLGIIYCFFGYLLSYIFIQFAENVAIVTTMRLFPLTIMVCTNLHWLGLILIIVGGIALYGKRPPEEVPLR